MHTSPLRSRALRASAALAALALCACTSPPSSGPPAPDTPPPADSLSPELLALLTPRPASSAAPPLSDRRADALAANLAERTADARNAPEHPTRMQRVAGTFLLVAGDPNARLDAAAALTQRLYDTLYAGPFRHRIDRAASVWLYTSERALARGTKEHLLYQQELPGLGFYDFQTRAIVLRTDAAGLGTLSHELLHVFVESDYPDAPEWLNEGLASLFEVADFSVDGGIHFGASFRLQTLRDALAAHDPATPVELRLDALFATPDWRMLNGAERPLRYALARECLRWLASKHQLWPFYEGYRDRQLEDSTGAATFARVTGKTPAEATADFLAWVNSPDAERSAP